MVKKIRNIPGGADSRGKLLRLVDKEVLIEILDAFTNATGLTANIVDMEGKSIFSKNDAQKNCEFCRMIRKMENDNGVNRCRGSYARAGKQAAMFDEPYIFRCPAGLIEWAAPVIIDGENLGTIICGQVLMWEPEEFFWIELEEMNAGLTSDFKPLFAAAKELQVVSGEKVQSAATLLYIIANYIVRAAFNSLRQEKELALQQMLLNQEIQTRKELEEKLNRQSVNFFIQKEKAMLSKIRQGDSEAGIKIFKVILSDIYADSLEQLPVIRARVFELIVVISRTLIELGVEPEQITAINSAFLQEIWNLQSISEINDAALSLLEGCLKKVKHGGDVTNKAAVQVMKGYIRNNYSKNLSLEEVADAAYLSASYASRIFKASEKMTVTDYVTQVKMDEAKKMLSNPDYKIDEIAISLGYNDSSYFSRVFKRNEGITPTKYRQSL